MGLFNNLFSKSGEVNKGDLVAVFKDTRNLSRGKFKSKTDDAISKVKVYRYAPTYPLAGENVTIDIVREGTVQMGYHYASKYHAAILNFADALIPGGLVTTGAKTQEENICRCSNLYETLIQPKCRNEYYDYNKSLHGFEYSDNIIYSPDVLVFKDDVTYDEIMPRKMDVITCPAPSCHFATEEEALSVYTKRVKNIIMSAIDNEAECIIFGAWGCGAFHQSPELIALAFTQVLNDFAGHFKKIVFAFRHTPTYKETDENWNAFVKTITENYKYTVNVRKE